MFAPKTTIVFAIFGIAIVLGFICGVPPGVFLQSYALLGIGLGFLLLIIIILIITIIINEYQHKTEIASTRSIHTNIFSERLVKREKILLTFTGSLLFTAGILLGVLCELLLKAISVSLAVHITIAAIFIAILLILFIVILIVELKVSRKPKTNNRERYPVLVEPVTQTKSQDTTGQTNRNRSRHINDDTKYIRQDSSFNSSIPRTTNIWNTSKPPSTIQREYQSLLNPLYRFHVNEKVYDNRNNIAEIIEVDGLGNYRIQYLDNGLIDFKNGTELRKA